MAFCNNCGHELIDGVKFCSNCGASVESGMVPRSNLQTELKGNQNFQRKDYDRHTLPATVKPAKKKTGRLFAFLLFIASSFILIMNASLINTLLAAGVIVAGVYFFKQGYKFKIFTVLAMLMAVISILAWTSGLKDGKTDDDMYAYKTEETEQPASGSNKNTQTTTSVTKKEKKTETEAVKEDKQDETSEPSETRSVEEKTGSSEETSPVQEEQAPAETEEKQAETNNGVDPDLKAFLDSYEKFVDEYVDFMKKYSSDPGNAIAMMDDYTRIMKQYADFADKINKYDTQTMSKADLEYYLDVTNRCSKKMLSAAY